MAPADADLRDEGGSRIGVVEVYTEERSGIVLIIRLI
jgi:hypothetical protein